jgi:hypothetical protein
VRTTNGFATGLDIDRLVLRSPAAGSVLAPTPPPSPAVRVRDEGRTRLAVDVDGAQPGTPFWLVLGQSHSEGWRAALDKTNLGTPTLVNGFANGWLVEPPAGQFTIDLEWRPQRWVWLAIAVSALANLLCLALAILSRPELAGDTRRVPPLRLLPQVRMGVVGVVVVFGLVVATPAVVVVGGATTAAAAWVPPTRRYIRAFPALLVATAGSYVAIQQWRYDYPAAFEWPIHFSRVHQIGWMAIVVLVGITVVDGLARHLPTKEQG